MATIERAGSGGGEQAIRRGLGPNMAMAASELNYVEKRTRQIIHGRQSSDQPINQPTQMGSERGGGVPVLAARTRSEN
jgi:hypothetical protein